MSQTRVYVVSWEDRDGSEVVGVFKQKEMAVKEATRVQDARKDGSSKLETSFLEDGKTLCEVCHEVESDTNVDVTDPEEGVKNIEICEGCLDEIRSDD